MTESIGRCSVLFVCLGNICRSPTAHGVFAHKVDQSGLQSLISVDSAGTAAYHVGNPPDKRSARIARSRGYDLSSLRARQVVSDDFHIFDYILAMDNSNLFDLQQLQPPQGKAQVKLFLDYAPQFSEQEVPDPYYGGSDGFEYVLDLAEAAADGLLQEIKVRLRG
ncbi:MAG: low molecular weight phosphotyrosine protein phosphatase [Motiliproteus sp.]|nr:low molecular weight phosphotyrosine protein phosphatase [Motiliproteus sp.]MCW9051805.1 low molecular weight phosphotyrosine protein phosphatase [Motiliproteus sp.]